jgi:hypothetical protein
MPRKLILTAILAAILGTAGADAQAQRSRQQEGLVRVQLQIQMFITGPTDDSEEANKHRERARRALYDMAARECELMKAVIANDCRLETVNVNLNRQSNQQMNGYLVMGSMAYQITLK